MSRGARGVDDGDGDDLERFIALARGIDGQPPPELLARLRGELWQRSRRELGPGDALRKVLDSEDLAQEALFAVARALPEFRGTTWPELLAFARAILDRCVQDRARHAKARKRDAGQEERIEDGDRGVASPSLTPSAEAVASEDRARATALLSGLPQAYREPLERRLAGESYEAIAADLGVTTETARQRISRALKLLRQRW